MRLFHDEAVQFHGDARGVDSQVVQEAEDRLPLGDGSIFSIDDDLNGHAWLTPLFSNHYSQV
jgi:hypothetical protein